VTVGAKATMSQSAKPKASPTARVVSEPSAPELPASRQMLGLFGLVGFVLVAPFFGLLAAFGVVIGALLERSLLSSLALPSAVVTVVVLVVSFLLFGPNTPSTRYESAWIPRIATLTALGVPVAAFLFLSANDQGQLPVLGSVTLSATGWWIVFIGLTLEVLLALWLRRHA
jgi:hypothetical protein